MIKSILKNKKGESNLTLVMIISAGVIIAGAMIGFKKSLDNFSKKGTTNVESQQYTSPSTQLTIS